MSDKDEICDVKYWPFDLLSTDNQSEQYQKEMLFLDTAYREGFESFVFETGNMGANSQNRAGVIIYRGKWRREIFLAENGRNKLSAYLDDFECSTVAILDWLKGFEVYDILEKIKPHLAKMSGARERYKIYEDI